MKEDAFLDGRGTWCFGQRKTVTGIQAGPSGPWASLKAPMGIGKRGASSPPSRAIGPPSVMPPRGINALEQDGQDGTEIDIMEKPWREDKVQHALHWNGYGEGHKSEGKIAEVPGVSQGWHTFGLRWTPEEYVFYVDGSETWRTAAGGICQVPVYVKLTEEIGEWGGKISEAILPDQFRVDYVRVYQEKPAGSGE